MAKEVPASVKVTIRMNAEQVAELDRLSIDHRLETGEDLSRGYVVYRGLAAVNLERLARDLAKEART